MGKKSWSKEGCPVSTIFKVQDTVNAQGENVTLKPKAGRHDPGVLPRAVPMVEAMATLVVMDQLLRQLPVRHARGPLAIDVGTPK